jgi:hypothetical protein
MTPTQKCHLEAEFLRLAREAKADGNLFGAAAYQNAASLLTQATTSNRPTRRKFRPMDTLSKLQG